MISVEQETIYSKVFSLYKRAFHAVKNAATVPQIVIKMVTASNEASMNPHLPSRAILANIGPIIQVVKLRNEPKKAIRELNSGMRIDTIIHSTGMDKRSTMKIMRFKSRRRGVEV